MVADASPARLSRPAELCYRPMPRALLLGVLAVGVDGTFCLFLDYMVGVEGAALHLARLGPALVLAALFHFWLSTSAHNPGHLSSMRLWGGVTLTWALAYALGLWASTTLGAMGTLLALFALGGLGALAVAWTIAPAIPGILRGARPLWLIASGASLGAAGGSAFLALADGVVIHQFSPITAAFLFNGALFLPWTLALMVIVVRSSDPVSPDCQKEGV